MRAATTATVVVFASIASIAGAGCSDLSRFTTEPGKSYCGTVDVASFVRAGIPPGTRMRLELDADQLQSAPGRIWTDEIDPDESFSATALLAIPQLANDPLSTLDFGEGRTQNTLTIAMLGGAQVFVVLSLMQNGDVEVRLIRGTSPGSIPAGAPPTPSQIFGVFHLQKQDGDCGLH